MKILKPLLLVVVLGAVAGSVWLFRQSPSASAVENVSDERPVRASANGPALGSRPARPLVGVGSRVDPAHVAIENGVPLMEALTTHTNDGRIESEAQANLAFLAASCHQAPDLTPAQSDGFRFDETRAWAIARLVEICAGYDPKQFKVTVPRPNLMASMRSHGWAGTESIAAETIATSGIVLDVYTAGELMMENDAFPFDEILPGMQQDYGSRELTTAWLHASTLAACDKVGGCGRNSMEVVQVCANVGCKEGLDLVQALEQRLPPPDFRATMAMYSWLSRRRSSR